MTRTHGHYKGRKGSPTYVSWQSMKARAGKKRGYEHVSICERWKSSFENFLADMGERPSLIHTLDRIDPYGNYGPDNCRWATAAEQMVNRRNTVKVNGEPIIQLADRTGISVHKLRWRLRIGATPEQLLSEGRLNRHQLCGRVRRDVAGENNVKATLTEMQVRKIREDVRGSTTVGREYGVSAVTIRNIRNFKTWKYVL